MRSPASRAFPRENTHTLSHTERPTIEPSLKNKSPSRRHSRCPAPCRHVPFDTRSLRVQLALNQHALVLAPRVRHGARPRRQEPMRACCPHTLSAPLPLCPCTACASDKKERLRVRLYPHALSLLPFAPRASRHHSRNPTRAARAPTLPRNPEARRPPAPSDRLLCGRSTICSSTSATASSPSKSARTSTTSTSGPRRASSRAPAMGTASAATTRPATTSEHRPAKPTPPRPPPPAPSALTGPRHPSRAGATVRSPRTSAPTACGPRRARGASGPSRTDPRAATT